MTGTAKPYRFVKTPNDVYKIVRRADGVELGVVKKIAQWGTFMWAAYTGSEHAPDSVRSTAFTRAEATERLMEQLAQTAPKEA